MKHWITALMALCVVFSASGCGANDLPSHDQSDTSITSPNAQAPAFLETTEPSSEAATDAHIQENDIIVGERTYTIRRIGVESAYYDWPVLDTVEIYRNRDFSAPTQTFENFTYDAYPPLGGEFLTEDLNFDGWPDFRIFGYQGRIGSGWFYWCWNPDTEEFVLQKEMEDIMTPIVDQAEQIIYGSRIYGPGGFSFSTFQWEDGALAETQRFSVEWDGTRLINRWYIRQNGELHTEKEWYVKDFENYGDSMVVPVVSAGAAISGAASAL